MLTLENVTLRKSKIPVTDLIQEAIDLKTNIRHDKEILVKRGLDWKLVEDLDEKAFNCSLAEAKWVCTKHDSKAITVDLKELVKECKKVRSQISISLRRLSAIYDLGFRVPAYSQKNKYSHIVQDLYDMWYVCNNRREFLTNLGFDMSVPDKAYDLHLKLSKRIAFAVNERPRYSPDRQERDRLREELFSIISTIRDFAKMVFTGDHQKCRNYVFNYYRTSNRKRLSRLRASKKISFSGIDGRNQSDNGDNKPTNGINQSTTGNIKTSNGRIKSTNGIIRSNDGKVKSSGLKGSKEEPDLIKDCLD